MTDKWGLMTTAAAICLAIGTTSLEGQTADAVRLMVDTAKRNDTTKRLDATKGIVDSTSAAAVHGGAGVSVGSPKKSTHSARTVEGLPTIAPDADVNIPAVDGPVRLAASLSERTLTVMAGENAVKTFRGAVGTSTKPTPRGSFKIRKIVWNPAWIPPAEPWAKGKAAKGPGEPGNPMKVAKIFFQEPDYYIHGTGQVNSLGTADSHGCLRMSPDEVAALAKFLMEHGGQAQEEGWFSRVVHLRWQTHTVELTKPVSLTITD